jgi:hypothetical protein
MKDLTTIHVYLPLGKDARPESAEKFNRASAFFYLARVQQAGFDLRPVSLIAGQTSAGFSLALTRDHETAAFYQVINGSGDVHAVPCGVRWPTALGALDLAEEMAGPDRQVALADRLPLGMEDDNARSAVASQPLGQGQMPWAMGQHPPASPVSDRAREGNANARSESRLPNPRGW